MINIKYILTSFILLMFILSVSATTDTYSTPGSYTWTCPTGVSSVNYLVVAGGGGGGYAYAYGGFTGGGGAGGVLTGSTSVTPGTGYTVTVGTGGGSSSTNGGENGGNSVFSSSTSIGGGGGGTYGGPHYTGNSGGSGGGGSGSNGMNYTGGAGTSGQGYLGATGMQFPGGYYGGGGGGGKGEAGHVAPNTSYGGNGGSGYDASAFGLGIVAGGGGAGGFTYGSTFHGGLGGLGGGGNGATGGVGSTATANTGGGGGGAAGTTSNINYYGGGGGTGIVVLTYTASPPSAPTNVRATDGTYTDKVLIQWDSSYGATNYKVYEGSNLLTTTGDVQGYYDTAAGAPTLTVGTATASNGTSSTTVELSISGQSAAAGATRTYKVQAGNAVGYSGDSNTDTGYRGVGSITNQWYRSASTTDASYSAISGATSASYSDTNTSGIGAGRFYKSYVSASGATSSYTNSDYGYIKLISNFTANKTVGNASFAVQFTDTTTSLPTSWQWTFGDGGSSTSQNPIYVYNTVGLYSVTLTTSDIQGSNTTTKSNYINVTSTIPVASFNSNVTSGVGPLAVAFSDTSVGGPTSWNWTFGGANYSSLQNPTYTFSGIGRYTVVLNASNIYGFNRTTYTNYINVSSQPVNINSKINLTPSTQPITIAQNATMQMNVKNVTGYFVISNFTFNSSSVNIMGATNNFSVYPGLKVISSIDNTNGFINMNITRIDGGIISIGSTETPIVDVVFKGMSYTNTSVPLNFNLASIGLVSGGTEGFVTKQNGMATVNDGLFHFTIKLLNSATTSTITTLVTLSATGQNVTPVNTTTETGTISLTSNYGMVALNISSNGYYTYSNSILVDSNEQFVIKLTPIGQPSQNTWYSPHQVTIAVVDRQYGNKVQGATIDVTPMMNTFPTDGSSDWLVTAFGINAATANDMMNDTLIMSGTTTDNGETVFTMLSSIGYNLHVYNVTSGIDYNAQLFPMENQYNILINEQQTDSTLTDMATTNLTYVSPNATYGTFGLIYHDTSSRTTTVNFQVINVDNGTIMYTTDLSGFGSNVIQTNYTIKSVRGEQYVWLYNATRV